MPVLSGALRLWSRDTGSALKGKALVDACTGLSDQAWPMTCMLLPCDHAKDSQSKRTNKLLVRTDKENGASL